MTPPPRSPHIPRIAAIWSLLAVAACVTTAELLLRLGAQTNGQPNGLSAAVSPYTLMGVAFHIAGFAAWAYTLRSVPLALAFSFTTLQQATVALGAWYFLHEQIPPARWLGIALVLTGVLLLVPAIVNAEKKTEEAP
jgi:drug/metabolite transporter (DMT)-like permease